ncbi:MAG: calcium/sodium antiporter [Acidimicrobiia bacterium]|nr:calcium/sodium antiporter [Acidimicrobiia bacterium]
MGLLTVVLFVVGLAALVGGSELLVRGAVRLATRTGISSVVIGLTVVAFGTSTPELAVSIQAAVRDEAGLALGNVVGSNIANVLAVLGLGAVVGGSLVVAQRIVRIDVPVMVGATVALLLLSLDGRLGRLEGALLVVALVVYLGWIVRATRRESAEVRAEYDEALDPDTLAASSVATDVGLMVAGLVGLVLGAHWLVDSATEFALWIGLSSTVVGLTVVALGTSMPEMATTVVAALRGERDLAVGNAIGSNILNILAVLGLTAVLSPSALLVDDQLLGFDLWVMLAVAVACLPIFFTGWRLARWEGAVFCAYYVGYLAVLVLGAVDHDAEAAFRVAMAAFMVPLTLVTLVVVVMGVRSELRGGTAAANGRRSGRGGRGGRGADSSERPPGP